MKIKYKNAVRIVQFRVVSLLPIYFILVAGMMSCSNNDDKLPKNLLTRFNNVCDSTDIFSNIDEAEIDGLKLEMGLIADSDTLKWHYLIKISGRYRQVQTDSAMEYSLKAIDMAKKENNRHRILMSQLSMVDALSAGGFFTAAERRFDSISHTDIELEDKARYWLTARRLYSGIYDYVEDTPRFSEDYREKYVKSDDSLLKYLPDGDIVREFIICERLVATGRNVEAISRIERLLSKMDQYHRLYGMTAYQMAKAYRNEGQSKKSGEYLALAAESDIRRNVREGLAMPAFASWLYSEGRFAEAFRFINLSMVDANAGNARTRAARIAKLVPLIDEAYRNEINTARKRLILSIIIVSFLLLVLAVLLFTIFRELRRRRKDKDQLLAVSRLKDQYIGSIIELCSTYSDKYESLQKMVDRKLSSGQANELLKIVKSGKLSEEENIGLFKIIDPILLNIYPDFVDKVNALLRPEERLEFDKVKCVLTPELRICFFISFGVTDSQKIARVLNYSVNTVYTYRNRLRKKAIDHDNFDQAVKEIFAGK